MEAPAPTRELLGMGFAVTQPFWCRGARHGHGRPRSPPAPAAEAVLPAEPAPLPCVDPLLAADDPAPLPGLDVAAEPKFGVVTGAIPDAGVEAGGPAGVVTGGPATRVVEPVLRGPAVVVPPQLAEEDKTVELDWPFAADSARQRPAFPLTSPLVSPADVVD